MSGETLPFPTDAVVEVYKQDIDRTLLRENLRRSATERFERLNELQRFAEELQRAGRASRAASADGETMTAIEILRKNNEIATEVRYRAIAHSGSVQSVGKTVGEALDALTAQLSDEQSLTASSLSSLALPRIVSINRNSGNWYHSAPQIP